MSGIALQKILVPAGASEKEAGGTVGDLVRVQDATTKADLKTGLAPLESRMN